MSEALKITNEQPQPSSKVLRGFGTLPCPRCASETAIAVYLDDLTSLRCADCEETFDLADVRALVEKWAPVLRWLDSAPAAE